MKKLLLGLVVCSGMLMADFSRDDSVGVVTDMQTGLMWQDDANTSLTWQDAVEYCEALKLWAYGDWRLPEKEELRSIVGQQRYNPASDPAFKNSVSDGYWTATLHPSASNYVWMVDFDDGSDIQGYKTRTHFVRCVRGGK